jgi:poly-gamma-glutamate capsule biosynthesis protein CapA/YwtB (metallophosphatase superfamily)
MNKKNIVLSLSAITAIFLIILSAFFIQSSKEPIATQSHQVKTYNFVTKEKIEPKVTTAKIAAIGDILVHSPVYYDARTADGGYDFTPMFEPVKPYLENADITIANQETMIGGTEIGLSTYPRFNSPYEVGDALKYIGVDVVSLANNHTLDRGEVAIQNAISHWNKINMIYTGAYSSEEDSKKIRYMTKNDIKFSFLSYTYGTNGIPIPKGKEFLVNLIDKDKMKKDIAEAKENSEVVIVSMHFGNEYQLMPSQYQIDLANFLANEGVDIVIGHHPHVLQPVKWIERPDGKRTFVAYSLGNFISAQKGINRLIGGILHINVQKTVIGKNVEISLNSPTIIPTYTHAPGYKNFRIIPMAAVSNEQLNNVDKYLNDFKNLMTHWVTELNYVDSIPTSGE